MKFGKFGLGARSGLVAIGIGATMLLSSCAPKARKADIVIYGGSSSGIAAAVQASRMGKSVIVVSPDEHIGGLSSSGLGFTDTGNKSVIGGISREFYHRVWKYYGQEESWVWQKRSEYGNKGQGTSAMDGAERTMWIFEPSIAEKVFEDLVAESGIEIVRGARLDRGPSGVEKANGRIVSLKTLDGVRYEAAMYIDATYEGDLMAASGVSYHVGRESNAQYGENWNGVQVGVLHHGHHFGAMNISPYVVPGDPSSGLLPLISDQDPGRKGDADARLQAYCFRTCLTNNEANRVPFPMPEGYDADRYALLLRVFETGWDGVFKKFDPVPNWKTDTNNHGPVSYDFIGMNYDYPEASYERRTEIVREHELYQKGLLYFTANDPRVPAAIREPFSEWGLAKDEFADNGNWPYQLYIREARRMLGEQIMTEHHVTGAEPVVESIGMGSYTLDSHNTQRYVTSEGYVQNEGDIGVHLKEPYRISYGSITPKKSECENLLVSVCVSSTHMAFGSIRMEPVFMILGQSAASAAAMAIDGGVAVQDLEYESLRAALLKAGQRL